MSPFLRLMCMPFPPNAARSLPQRNMRRCWNKPHRWIWCCWVWRRRAYRQPVPRQSGLGERGTGGGGVRCTQAAAGARFAGITALNAAREKLFLVAGAGKHGRWSASHRGWRFRRRWLRERSGMWIVPPGRMNGFNKENQMQIGMIGLGRMGANMVRRLQRAGHQWRGVRSPAAMRCRRWRKKVRHPPAACRIF